MKKLGMLRKVVEGSLTNKTDKQLLSLLLNEKDIKALQRQEANTQPNESNSFDPGFGAILD